MPRINPEEQDISRRSFLAKLITATGVAVGAGLAADLFVLSRMQDTRTASLNPDPDIPSGIRTPTPAATPTATDSATPTTTPLNINQILNMYTDPYLEGGNVPSLERTRVLRINADTVPQIIRLGGQGELFFKNTYPKILCEVAFQREAVPYGDAYTTSAANALLQGLRQAYPDTDRPLVIALEAGHMSNPPAGIPTLDTGTGAGGVPERRVNHKVCEQTAKIIGQEQPNWIVVLNSRKNGFPVDRLEEDGEYSGINHQDGIVPMNYIYEQMGQRFKKIGVDMVALSIHHNDSGDQSLRGGYIYTPDTGSYIDQSEKIGTIMGSAFEGEIRQIISGYRCRVQRTPKFYWILDVYDGDSQDNVRNGIVTNYGCVSNLIAAKLRHKELG